MATYHFPENFLWGTATAGHQVEGNNVNTDGWVLEHLKNTVFSEPSGDACDHYHRYPEDIALLASMGFNSYRFSVEWSRIEPAEGEFSMAALDHYRRMLQCCHDNNLKPVVTFHHFVSPRWFAEQGGWLSPTAPEKFARFIEKASQHFGDLISVAVTFNEANIAKILKSVLPFNILETDYWKEASETFGVAPDKLGIYQFIADTQMWDIIFESHVKARDILKNGPGDFPVGLSVAMVDYQAVDGGEENKDKFNEEINDIILERLGDDDFVGVQTYTRCLIGPDGIVKPPEGTELNQMNEEFYPEAIGGTIRHAAKVSGIPVIVTENGLAIEDDTRRVEYFKSALKTVHGCIEEGIDVQGYYCWSAMDNFEWVAGYGPKFGVISVDRNTQKRTPKPSGLLVGKIAQENKLEF